VPSAIAGATLRPVAARLGVEVDSEGAGVVEAGADVDGVVEAGADVDGVVEAGADVDGVVDGGATASVAAPGRSRPTVLVTFGLQPAAVEPSVFTQPVFV